VVGRQKDHFIALRGESIVQEWRRKSFFGREYFCKPGARGVHSAVDFQGVLQVTDGPKFRETFARGIGPAKAFGFGLLVLAPLQ